jgi:hypothetical protein
VLAGCGRRIFIAVVFEVLSLPNDYFLFLLTNEFLRGLGLEPFLIFNDPFLNNSLEVSLSRG